MALTLTPRSRRMSDMDTSKVRTVDTIAMTYDVAERQSVDTFDGVFIFISVENKHGDAPVVEPVTAGLLAADGCGWRC